MSAASREVTGSSSGGGTTQWPPSWNVGPHSIATGRYIDPAFAKLEHEKLWSRVWQIAARVDELPQPGDYTVYEIVDQSVLLVRTDETTIKAYHNVCPHRGTALGEGCGTFERRTIMCPFHGWRWNLEGQNQFVLERHEFRGGQLRDSDVALKEIKSVVFEGFVFINFDKNAQPFDDYIAPLRPLLESLSLGLMRHYWWKSIPVAANWKVAQEAFFEGYHVPATHPQLEVAGAEMVRGLREPGFFSHHNVDYETYPNGHGRFFGKKTPMTGYTVQGDGDAVDRMAARLNLLATGMDAQVLPHDIEIIRSLKGKIPADANVGAEYVKALYADAAATQRPMPPPTPENIGMWGGEIFIFPNFLILPQGGNAMMYRAKPVGNDPDRCTFEILSTTTFPAAVQPKRAVVQHVTDLADPKQVLEIPRQDLGNIPRMQIGLHSRGIKNIWLASHNEKMILNMHQEMDRYLQRP